MPGILRNNAGRFLQSLEDDAAVIYLLDRYLRIAYCNRAWNRFAAENGGRGLDREGQLGRSVMDSIPMALKPFFCEGYRRVLSTGQTWEHSYECSSPAIYRVFRMVAYPNPEGEGLVVVNSLSVARDHERQEGPQHFPDGLVYSDRSGTVTMCCHCRRTCRTGEGKVWDWVPAYLEEPPRLITHGICAVCMNVFYPKLMAGANSAAQ